MPDAIFDDPRVAAVYDGLDPDRSDLDEYERILVDLGARSVLDIGCGTGVFALRLAARGLRVTGVDPARASVEVARSKPGTEAVTWVVGTADTLPPLEVDAVTMTANVAQVFLTDQAWHEVLTAAHRTLKPGGMLVFEARNPHDRAWERWTQSQTRQVVEIPGHGPVEDWVEVTAVDGELVTFESPTIFHRDTVRVDSTSTLRFRSRSAIVNSLREAGFGQVEVRDLGHAPGRGWLYCARKD